MTLAFTTSTQWLCRSRVVVWGRQQGSSSRSAAAISSLTMRDHSASYWFQVGNQVKVVDDVAKNGINLKHRTGKVVETWEKCDVDPTCCCAEQVDTGMAVRVEFQGTEAEETQEGSFYHYFAEEELLQIKEDSSEQQSSENTNSVVPFDGMSCVAFKLDHLKMGQQAQRLAAFEASRAKEEENTNE